MVYSEFLRGLQGFPKMTWLPVETNMEALITNWISWLLFRNILFICFKHLNCLFPSEHLVLQEINSWDSFRKYIHIIFHENSWYCLFIIYAAEATTSHWLRTVTWLPDKTVYFLANCLFSKGNKLLDSPMMSQWLSANQRASCYWHHSDFPFVYFGLIWAMPLYIYHFFLQEINLFIITWKILHWFDRLLPLFLLINNTVYWWPKRHFIGYFKKSANKLFYGLNCCPSDQP